jgi:plasmid stabilization system protein ParE
MSSFRLGPTARVDLDEIADYVAAVDGLSRAESVRGTILRGLRRLAAMPHIGHTRDDLSTDPIRFWPIQGYLVAYRVVGSRVEIARILHGARDPAFLDEAVRRGRDVGAGPGRDTDVVEESALPWIGPCDTRRSGRWTLATTA